LGPLEEHCPIQVAKFIKRRLTRTYNGIVIGLLFAFPALADVYGVEDEFHTDTVQDRTMIIAKFCGQVGSLFWDIHAALTLDQDEHEMLNRILSSAYRKLGLRRSGSLPGYPHEAFPEGRLMFAVPPLYFAYDQEDWAEYLWDHVGDRYCLLPSLQGPLLLPPFEPGLEFIANEGGILNVLEDIGTVEKMRMQMEYVEVNVSNRRLFRSFLAGYKRSYRCRYTDFAPSWVDRLLSDYHACPNLIVI
jgi:hypothetical protein